MTSKEGEKERSTKTKTPVADYYAATHLQVSALAQKTRILTECRPHVCSVCGYPFQSNSKLVRHFRNHTGEKPFNCSYCPRTFRQKSHLEGHERFHRGDRIFSCSLCPKSYVMSSGLTDHIRTIHAKIRGYPCSDCSNEYFHSGHLTRHRFKVHNVGLAFVCSQTGCEKKFVGRAELNQHLRSTHKILLPYECSKCDHKYRTKRELLCHEGTHEQSYQDIEAIKLAFLQQQQIVHGDREKVTRQSRKLSDENSKSNKENANKQQQERREKTVMEAKEEEQNKKDDSSGIYCGYCSCGKTFSCRDRFHRHRRRRGHSRAKVHECPICLVACFKTIKGLEQHYYSHDLNTRKCFEKS